ncbi:Crp/Fnr family transcriptional regulator [Cerasicoccus maritimus]|uniref:Crp/Fnr family transcriptional regulator n=1 Tax=Cerasicoccus maritimus TaxID=490089 RepID=UPI002852A8AA|nr:Crp/Fnr family transcriptional regulator [Cerasicoccus maritimus]
MDRAAIIAQCSLFNGLNEEDVLMLAAACETKQVGRGEVIFLEGVAAVGFYVVATGQVKIYKSNAEGREKILHIFGPGESFAEVPVFHGDPYPASAMAMKASEVLCFPRARFVEIIEQHPSLSMNMLANFAQKLRRFSMQIENLALREVPARLASHLIYLSESQKRTDAVTLRVPKGQLANLLGTTPETLSRVLGRLEESGVIRSEGKAIALLDWPKLRELAG